MADIEKYTLRFFFEWGGGCLWAGNESARAKFGYGPLDSADTKLPLSSETVRQCQELSAWYDTSLNQRYPPDPGPWRQPECDQFNEMAEHLLSAIRAELGGQFEVINHQPEAIEDPDLDAYLADPKGFRRQAT